MRLSPILSCAFLGLVVTYAVAQSGPPPTSASLKPLIPRTSEAVEKARQEERHHVLDIVATDASGKAISGLTQQDLKLGDGAVLSQIISFEPISSATARRPPVQIIFVLDTLNASFQDVIALRQGLEHSSTRTVDI